MRYKSPEKMEQIREYIGNYYRINHCTPTTREIAAEVDLAQGNVQKYLVEMDEKGMLSYRNGVISGIDKMNKTFTRYFSAPLVGSIACGDPENEQEQVEYYVSLPEDIFGTGQFYLLRAKGDSMEDANIFEDDLLLIHKQENARPGDIVVALDDNNENTLKKYGGIDKKTKKVVLEYQNEAVYPGKKIYVDFLKVQGVVRSVIHTLPGVLQ